MKKILPTILFALLFFGGHAQSVRDYLKSSKKNAEAGNLKEALSAAEQAAALDPNSEEAWEQVIRYAEGTYNLPRALEAAEKLLALKPEERVVLEENARLNLENFNYGKAADQYKKLAGSVKRNDQFLAMYALALVWQGNYEEALAAASQALLQNNANHIALRATAIAEDSLRKPEASLGHYASAITELSKSKEFNSATDKAKFKGYLRGAIEVACKTKQVEAALKYTALADSWGIQDADFKWLQGKSQQLAGNWQGSLEPFGKAISANSKKEAYFLSRGLSFEKLNQAENALSDYSTALAIQPASLAALKARAFLNLNSGNLKEARTDFDRAITLSPKDESLRAGFKETSEKLLEKSKETNAPQIELTAPFLTRNKKLVIPEGAKSILIRGLITDQSLIQSVTVNNVSAVYRRDQNNPAFECELSTKDLNQVVVSVTDIYQNNQVLVYGILLAESRGPEIDIIGPAPLADGSVPVSDNKNILVIEGKIQDKSMIDNITINGIMASFSPTELNPRFSASVDITGYDSIKVTAKDIFGNASTKSWYLNRNYSAGIAAEVDPMGKTWVVFLENFNYSNLPSLNDVPSETGMVRNSLKGYRVDSMIIRKNLTKTQMERFLSIELRDLVARHQVNSIMIWYSGHGKATQESGFWLPVDANKKDEYTFFPVANLKGYLASYKPVKHTLVVADATETGPAFYLAMRKISPWTCGDWEAGRLKSAQVLSAAESERSSDKSSFSEAFAKTLQNVPDKCITIDKVSEKVIHAAQKAQKQKPKFGNIQDLGDENGTFFFIKR